MMRPTKTRLSILAGLVIALALAVGGSTAIGRSLAPQPEPESIELQASSAENPIAFQGVLTDIGGNPVANQSHQLTFSIYDGPDSNDNLLWQETQSVNTSEGLFSALLGSSNSISPSTFSRNPDTYIGVRVGSNSELMPRTQLAYAPYAMHSLVASDADTLDGLDASAFALRGQVQSNGSASSVSSFSPFSSKTVDSSGDTGQFTSIAIGVDGLPIISYFDNSGRDLKVAHCNDMECASASITTVDSDGFVGRYSSIAIGEDGFPVISYFDDAEDDLNFAKCNNLTCSSSRIEVVDESGDVGLFTAIAVGADGSPVITYYDESNEQLKVAHCDDDRCSDAEITDVDDFGERSSIAIGIDGVPVISYFDSQDENLKVARCTDDECDNVTVQTVDNSGDVGEYSDIAIGVDGLPIISYYDIDDGDLKVAHCSDEDCDSANISTLDSVGDVGLYTSIAIGADGLALISYFDASKGDLKIAHCVNTNCTTADRIITLDRSGRVGEYSSLAIGADGLPIVSYHQDATGDLKAARCAKADCDIP